jgi:PKD repeat protein
LSTRPVAWFWQSCVEVSCTFDGSGSWSGSGPIVNYTWNFGDGTAPISSGPEATHTFTTSGSHPITLTVANDSGMMGTRSVSVFINLPPIARFTYTCSGWRCAFDASSSSDPEGQVLYYYWNFGDGYTASGATATHLYNSANAFTVTLIVNDNAYGYEYATGSQQQVVDLSSLVNAPPVASFTVACAALTCTFDGSGSSDSDGIITSYAWAFGDGTTSSGVGANHTYAAAGTYTVGLTVSDNFGATSVQTATVTLTQPTMHIADLDGVRTNQQNTWTAGVTITAHDGNHAPLANATVTGGWSIGGTSSCTTDGSGQCHVDRWAIPRRTQSVLFTVLSVTKPVFLYGSTDNHDPDGDSNGTSITVNRP